MRHFISTTVAKSLFAKEKKDTGRKFLDIRLQSKSGPMKSLLSVSRTVDQSVIFSFAKTVHKFFHKLYVKTTRQNRAFLKKEISLCRKTTKTPPE